MKKTTKIILTSIATGLFFSSAWFTYQNKSNLMDAYRSWKNGPIPEAVSRVEFDRLLAGVPTVAADENSTDNQSEPNEPTELTNQDTEEVPLIDETPELNPPVEDIPNNEAIDRPTQFNLKVPFMVQAPFANWDELHGEACEEASAIMLAAYYNDETEITAEEAEERIMKAVDWEMENLGYHLDTTAEETALMLRDYFNITGAKVVELISMEQLLQTISFGRPVIVPAYGKALFNPYFRNGGPLYHMLIIKGYTDDKFITNDPGTKRGADYMYDKDILWNAIHDWNDGDVPNGQKVMIVGQ